MKNCVSINSIYLRKINHLTQPELANICGVNRDFISALENNKKKHFEIGFFQKISSHFKINIDDFVNKDLSKTKKADGYVNLQKAHHVIDRKTEAMYERIIKNYEDMLLAKNALIEEKELRAKATEKTIATLEKSIEQKNALLNQSAQIEKLEDILNAANNIDKIQRLYALIKIDKELEETRKITDKKKT